MQVGEPNKISEKTRAYRFPNGEKVELHGVIELIVRPSGTHRLKTADKRMHIIPTGWVHIEIDSEEWEV